jgi:hypothetical protein
MVRQAHHPEPSRRANSNDPNSKCETSDPSALVPNGIITGRPEFTMRCDTTVMNVLVIEYWNLKFICDLVLEIWDFIFESNL